MDFAPGLVALQEYLASKNPTEPDPLVIRRAGIPHWLGGYEALDGIFVYSIPKSSESPAYYHYITAGLSDLYGDGRVRFPVFENLSGFGIELTLKVEKSESSGIPHWPANILQRLARYIFETGNRIISGDDVPWGEAIDGRGDKLGESGPKTLLNNFIATHDETYSSLNTASGILEFIQLIPVTQEEFNAAHEWSPENIIGLMNDLDPNLLIADVTRGESIFDLAPELVQVVQEGLKSNGSDVCSFSGLCSWAFEDIRDTEGMKEVVRLKLSPDSALGLQKSISSRFRHKRHVTVKSADELHAISFFPEGCDYSATSQDNQFKVDAGMIQIFLPQTLIDELTYTLPSTKDASDAEYEFLQHNIIIEISETFP